MTLKHHTVKTVKVPPDTCLVCLMSPDKLLSTSKYTAFVKKLEDGKYHVRFVWKKFGMTKKFDVIIQVVRRGDVIEYRSTEESDYPFLIRFKVKPVGPNMLEIEVYSEMKAGLMADLFGRRDYAGFIEELIDTGLVNLLKELGGKSSGPGITCETCLLYDPKKKYCYYLRRIVEDPTRPPCKGKAYVSDQLASQLKESLERA